MAPKRGYCYKCDKFQTRIRRHVKTCKAPSPNRKRRCVTAGDSFISKDLHRKSSVTAGDTFVTTGDSSTRHINVRFVQTTKTERIDGSSFDTGKYGSPKASVLDMMRYGVSKANLKSSFSVMKLNGPAVLKTK